MSGYIKVVDHYKKPANTSKTNLMISLQKKAPIKVQGPVVERKRKIGVANVSYQESKNLYPETNDSLSPDKNDSLSPIKRYNQGVSNFGVMVVPEKPAATPPSEKTDTLNSTLQKNPLSMLENRKLVKLAKPLFKQFSEKARNLVSDCVASIPDQDDTQLLNLRGRNDPLSYEEWYRVVGVLIELIHTHFAENGEDCIDFAAIREARLALKATYSWAGYVDLDFNPIGNVKNISEDGVYALMRRKNNSKKGHGKKSDFSKRTLNVHAKVTGKTKRRTAESYGVLTPLDFCKEEKSKSEHDKYTLYCKKISQINSGEKLSDENLQESKNYIKFFIEDMKDARPEEYENSHLSNVLCFIKHFQIYEVVVETLTNRANMLQDFEHQCAMYLHCLKDLMKEFPPSKNSSVKDLNFEESPFMSLATIISLQIGREPNFLLDVSDLNPETAASHKPIYLVQNDGLFDVWVQSTLIIGSLNERQAFFAFTTLSDVLGISLKRNINSSDLLDFLRKYLLNLPDFTINRKQVEALGHAYFHFAYRQLLQHVDSSTISLPVAIKWAKNAVIVL